MDSFSSSVKSEYDDFDDIRPYKDGEVRDVIKRLERDRGFVSILAQGLMPSLIKNSSVGRFLSLLIFKWQTSGLQTVRGCQDLMASYFERLAEKTIEGMTIEGLEYLDPDRRYLFISNHRDIVLDSACLNYFLRRSGHETARVAVGDNLFSWSYPSDLMRINKSFIVKREGETSRQRYRQMLKTSEFIWRSLSSGHSVWIAQKEGRSKNGYDRTDPAVIKMLALAHKAQGGLSTFLKNVSIVPVSVSYEVDPCALKKAHELSTIEQQGHYEKKAQEDLESMLLGIVGYKGRVNIALSAPLIDATKNLDEICNEIDEKIVSNLRAYPTHSESAKRLSLTDDSFLGLARQSNEQPDRALQTMLRDLEYCTPEERSFYLVQYANLLKNKRDLL